MTAPADQIIINADIRVSQLELIARALELAERMPYALLTLLTEDQREELQLLRQMFGAIIATPEDFEGITFGFCY